MVLMAAALVFAQSSRTAPAVARFNLTVNSNAPNSRVYVNAVAQAGTAPLTIELNEGSYEIVIRAPGYQDYSTEITLSRDLTINAILRTAKFELTVNSNAPESVLYVDTRSVGAVPTTVTLNLGTYRVEVRAPGFEDFLTTVNLERNITINAALRPMLFDLSVTSNAPNATLFINYK